MSLEDYVEKVLENNPKFREAFKTIPRFRSQLKDIVSQSYHEYKGLVDWSRFTDKINRILGPVEAGIRYFSPLGTTGFGIYSLTKLLHYGLVKLPYSIYYTLKTGDFMGSIATGLAEVAKYFLPFGTLGDILPLYSKTVDNYIVRDSTSKLEELIGDTEPLTEEDGEGAQVGLPAGLAAYNPRVIGDKLYLEAPSPGYNLKTREVKDGVQEVYLDKIKGLFPSVLTRLKTFLPGGTKKLQLHRKGLIKQLAN